MSDLRKVEFKNIIVRMPNWIGDLVMSTPVLADLRTRFPTAKITAMTREPLGILLQEDPHVDELFSFHKVNTFGRHDEKRRIIEKLREGKYDLGVLLTNSFSSAWWFWQGKVQKRLGFSANARGWFLSKAVQFPEERKHQHIVLTYKKLLEPLGIAISSTPPKLYLLPEEIEHVKQVLTSFDIPLDRPLIGINPGAAYGSAKCWLPERFRQVALEILDKTDASVLFFGDGNGISLVKEICSGLPSRIYNLAGKTSLRELASIISLCNVLLTNDSGPMHIAAALGTKIVALFGSTDAVVTGPYGSTGIIQKSVSCSPCFKRTCPIDFRCMKGITAEEVTAAILRILKT